MDLIKICVCVFPHLALYEANTFFDTYLALKLKLQICHDNDVYMCNTLIMPNDLHTPRHLSFNVADKEIRGN